jgi:mRNA interferase RelE/StbE
VKYRVQFAKSAEKELQKFPKKVILAIVETIEGLQDNPRPHGYKKLKGTDTDFYRVRSGNYRIIYTLDDQVLLIEIIRIAHRKDVYK